MCNLPINRFPTVLIECPECLGYILGKALPSGLAVVEHFLDEKSLLIDFPEWLRTSYKEIDGKTEIPKCFEDAFKE